MYPVYLGFFFAYKMGWKGRWFGYVFFFDFNHWGRSDIQAPRLPFLYARFKIYLKVFMSLFISLRSHEEKNLVTFMMVSCSSPLADFEDSSSPHSQGCSPVLSMGQTWAQCCRTGFSPGHGAVPVLSKAKRAWPGTAEPLSSLAVNACHSHGFSTFPPVLHRKQPTCCSLATRLSVSALAAGLWSQWFPLADHHWCFFSFTL